MMKRLLEAGLLHGETMTVTGKTLKENLDAVPTQDGQRVVYPVDSPLSPTGGLVILRGNLAPEGGVVKVSASQHIRHQGPAPGLRPGGGCVPGHTGSEDSARRRGGHQVRGAQGRPGDAGDAGGDRRHRGPGVGAGGCTCHRRQVLRRHPGPHGRPCRSRGGGGRAHRPRQGGRCRHVGHPRT